ncbi:MAG TPA: hypothetical protein DCG75_00240 [Bacteroidales bacterium]|jgi:hypothetical protein|nr:hypothetical protein [Bacteroidales bacterium]
MRLTKIEKLFKVQRPKFKDQLSKTKVQRPVIKDQISKIKFQRAVFKVQFLMFIIFWDFRIDIW